MSEQSDSAPQPEAPPQKQPGSEEPVTASAQYIGINTARAMATSVGWARSQTIKSGAGSRLVRQDKEADLEDARAERDASVVLTPVCLFLWLLGGDAGWADQVLLRGLALLGGVFAVVYAVHAFFRIRRLKRELG